MLYGFGSFTLFFTDFAEHVEGSGVDVAIINSFNKGIDPLIFCLSLFSLLSKSTPNCLSRYPPCLGQTCRASAGPKQLQGAGTLT
jgi:hypothetical protein